MRCLENFHQVNQFSAVRLPVLFFSFEDERGNIHSVWLYMQATLYIACGLGHGFESRDRLNNSPDFLFPPKKRAPIFLFSRINIAGEFFLGAWNGNGNGNKLEWAWHVWSGTEPMDVVKAVGASPLYAERWEGTRLRFFFFFSLFSPIMACSGLWSLLSLVDDGTVYLSPFFLVRGSLWGFSLDWLGGWEDG